jgi:hypothetical protein
MPHGLYIAEFENVLLKHSFAISRNSLSQLIAEVDFSGLDNISEADRHALYETLIDCIKPRGRGIENGLQILGEDDSRDIVTGMKDRAAQRLISPSRVRDIWCKIFIGGCP